VSNETTKHASLYATATPVTVNAPIVLAAFRSNEADNVVPARAKSESTNDTSRDRNPRQAAANPRNHRPDGDCKCSRDRHDDHDRTAHERDDGTSQSGTVTNPTEQEPQPSAAPEQPDVNAPTEVPNVDSDDGNVNQRNTADPEAQWDNDDEPWQHADHSQQAEGDAHDSHEGCGSEGRGNDGGYDKHEDSNGDGQDASASDSGKVEHESDQAASSGAQTKQLDLNASVSSLPPGSNHGEVNHGNDAHGPAQSSNPNSAGHSLGHQQLIE
jgi:hypothetical protein